MVDDYQQMPVPALENMKINYDPDRLLDREALHYLEEVRQEDRKQLDTAILRAMGFDKPEELLPELYQAFVELVDDRIIKGKGEASNRPRKSPEEMGDPNDKDN